MAKTEAELNPAVWAELHKLALDDMDLYFDAKEEAAALASSRKS